MLRASDTDSIRKLLYGIIQKAPKINSVTNEAISCPTCQSSKGILWLGTNPRGVARCRCIACQKNFCHHPSRLIAESTPQTAPAESLASRNLPWQTFRRAFRIS